jgi:flagellar biosynthetic protein FliR
MQALVSQFPEGQLIALALIFLRCVSFLVAWPVFGTGTVPVHIKVLLALLLSFCLLPVIHFQNLDLIKISDELLFVATREIFLGLFLGFLLRIFFFAVSMAGEIIGISSGLSSAQLFNPMMGMQTNVLEQIEVGLATLIFLAMNGHHLFLQGLAQSFDLIPVAAIGVKYQSFNVIAAMTQDIFAMAFKMASPVVVTVLITNITMGLIGRAVPQINVMMTGFQVTITVAGVVLIVSMPFFVEEMSGLFNLMTTRFFEAAKVL